MTYAVFMVGYGCLLQLADAANYAEAEWALAWFTQEVATRCYDMELVVEIRRLVDEQWLPLTVET